MAVALPVKRGKITPRAILASIHVGQFWRDVKFEFFYISKTNGHLNRTFVRTHNTMLDENQELICRIAPPSLLAAERAKRAEPCISGGASGAPLSISGGVSEASGAPLFISGGVSGAPLSIGGGASEASGAPLSISSRASEASGAPPLYSRRSN